MPFRVPPDFYCPILQEVFNDPVTTCDGHTYEYAAIKNWVSRHRGFDASGNALPPTSPLTNVPLANLELFQNEPMKKAIAAFFEQRDGGLAAAAGCRERMALRSRTLRLNLRQNWCENSNGIIGFRLEQIAMNGAKYHYRCLTQPADAYQSQLTDNFKGNVEPGGK